MVNMFIFYVRLKNVKKARQYSFSLRELFISRKHTDKVLLDKTGTALYMVES